MKQARCRFPVALVLVVALLVVGGLASAQSIAHESHHAHHQKATHGTVLCSWLCAAGQVLDGVVMPAMGSLNPVASTAPTSFTSQSSPIIATGSTRAPPII